MSGNRNTRGTDSPEHNMTGSRMAQIMSPCVLNKFNELKNKKDPGMFVLLSHARSQDSKSRVADAAARLKPHKLFRKAVEASSDWS